MKLIDSELVAQAVLRYEFRLPTSADTVEGYLKALVAHVEQRDSAAAHELRLNKRQCDWTPAEVDAWQDYMFDAHKMPRQEFRPGEAFAFPVVATPAGTEPVTEAHLLKLADRGLQSVIARRRDEPDWEGTDLCVGPAR
jgi:Arc/MetJ family transcription regulator